ncbi:hypothetical protein JCM1393_29020 [Clostridium carnis]
MTNLIDLYNSAREIKINEDSKIVFISDVHRGDGTYSDSLLPNKNVYKTALEYYLKQGFTYIEVGDGDELWKNRNCNDISYCYDDIFKILNKFKEKNRIYMIYGNHDIIKNRGSFYDSQYKVLRKIGKDYGKNFLMFIKDIEFYEALNLNYTSINEKILVTHGHQLDPMNSNYWIFSRFLVRYIWKFLNGVAGFKDPTSPAKNNKKGNKVDIKLEKWARDNYKMILCGHTHNSRLPGKYEPPYFNDGCCVLPYAMTSIEIEKGKISLIKWSVEVEEEGRLWVRRKVIAGPENLSEYLLLAREKRSRISREQKEG